ncbi:MAG: RNA 2',3'-cyclic phosphodiesterase [Kiritimatiellia bacterium]
MNISLAISIPDEIKHTLADAIERHSPAAKDVRWTERDRLQFPLVDIGEISPAFLPHITDTTEKICARSPAFPVHVYGFGFYGTKRFPHNIWAAVDPRDEMDNLYEAIWDSIEKFGFKKPVEDYRPHILLGSCLGGVKNRKLIDALDADEDADFGSWTAGKLTVYDCKSSKRGKVYRKIKQLPLLGGQM